MQVNTNSLAGWGRAEYPDDRDLLDVVAGELGDEGVQPGVGRGLVVVHHHQPHGDEGLLALTGQDALLAHGSENSRLRVSPV